MTKNGKRPPVLFYRITPVLEILRAAIWSGRLSGEKPVSVLLVAEQESCKTEALKFFRGTHTIQYIGDLTARGLLSYRSDIENGRLRHIVLMDLIRIVSHGKHTSERTMQTLGSLMEEGESDTADGGGQLKWANFPNIGVLMALTTSMFQSKRTRWRQSGFLTRFLPVSFSYSPETVHEIHLGIASGYKLPEPKPENLPRHDFVIHMNDKHSLTLSRRAEDLGKQMRTYGFRYQKTLRRLAMAQARINGRGEVEQEDVGKVLEWSEFFGERSIVL